MAVVQSYTLAKMQELFGDNIISAVVDIDGHLILTTRDGETIDAGDVRAPNLADASETIKGIVELATPAEVLTGTDAVRAVTPAGLSGVTATTARRGLVELATLAEVQAGADSQRAITPDTFKSVFLDRGYENKCINGDFRINQRNYLTGTSLTPGVLTGYAFDRWRTSGKTNLAMNPRGLNNVTSWVGSTSALSRLTGLTIPGLPGVTTAIRATMTGAASGGPYLASGSNAPYTLINCSVPYRVSAWLRCSVATNFVPAVQMYNAGGSVLGSRNSSASFNLVANTWTLVSWVFFPVDNAARIGPYWYASLTTGNTMDITGVTITEGPDFVNFFDGAMSGCHFIGTADQTPSVNRAVRTDLAFTKNPGGQLITINSGGAIQQVVERQNVLGQHTLSWEGTAKGRIYPKSEVMMNLFPNPSAEVSLDKIGAGDCVVTRSTTWASDGLYSFKQTPNAGTTDTWFVATGDTSAMRLEMVAGQTYTLTADFYQAAPQTGTLDARARRMVFFYAPTAYGSINSPQAPNVAGMTTLSFTFTVPATATEAFVRFYNGATNSADNSVYWDNISLVEGTEAIRFTGDTPDTSNITYDWTAGPGISSSVRTVNTVVPAYADSPITVTMDGLNDMIVEFEATGGTKTLDKVNFVSGAIAYPFKQRTYVDEMLQCQRYYFRNSSVMPGPRLSAFGQQPNTVLGEVPTILGVPLRGNWKRYSIGPNKVVMDWSGLQWTDQIGFNSAISGPANAFADHILNGDGTALNYQVTFASAGANRYGGCILATANNSFLAFSGEFF